MSGKHFCLEALPTGDASRMNQKVSPATMLRLTESFLLEKV